MHDADESDLLRLLTWKSDGWAAIFTQDIVYRDHGQGCENPHSYAEPLHSLRKSLEESKRCMKMLDKIRSHLGKRIRALRRRCMPLVLEDGIQRMPDELLAQIFETGHDSTDNSEFSVKVSHVSHRFRQVALKTAVLWTRLCVDDSFGQTESFISRSGDASLEVNLGLSRMKSFFRQHAFLKAVGLLSKRWSSVTDVSPTMVSRMAAVGLIEFPNLRHLDAFTVDVLFKWNMPLLTSIQGYTWFYTPDMRQLSQLTSINLRIINEHLDVHVFSETLHAMKAMRDLSLELHSLRSPGHDEVSPPCPAAEVPRPHSFKMEILTILLSGSMSDVIVQPLYDALAYLAPSTLVMSLQPDPDIYPSLNHANGKLFPYASTIQLHTSNSIGFHLLAQLIQECDIVCSIHLTTPEAHFFPTASWLHELPEGSSLRRLCIKDFCSLSERDVRRLTGTFLSANNDKRLHSLEFVSCKTVSEDFLLELQDEVGDGLKWSW